MGTSPSELCPAPTLIPCTTSPGLTWFCLYLKRGKTQREVPPEKRSPKALFPLSRKTLSALDQGPSSGKVTQWGLNDTAPGPG